MVSLLVEHRQYPAVSLSQHRLTQTDRLDACGVAFIARQRARTALLSPPTARALEATVPPWRIDSEVLSLEWRQVDFAAGEIRLDPGKTKNGEGRTFPMTRDLREVLEQQKAITENLQRQCKVVCPRVFHRSGRPIKSFRVAFRTACTEAGCPVVCCTISVERPFAISSARAFLSASRCR